MPSFEHEIVVTMLREHPEALLELLRLSQGLDHHGAIERVASPENLTELQPAERRADVVLVVRDTGEDVARVGLVVEVQLQVDARKRFAWPAYVAVARARLGCPVNLVVVTLDEVTAAWCAVPIVLDEHGSMLRPVVIGPGEVTASRVEPMRRHPELGVLGVLAHRDEPIALELARAAIAGCAHLDDETRSLYTDVVFAFLNVAARRALEAEMSHESFETQSEFLRERWARAMAQGREEGRAEALATSVLKVLQARGLQVSDDQRATLLACTDAPTLEAWLERAVTVGGVDQLFVG